MTAAPHRPTGPGRVGVVTDIAWAGFDLAVPSVVVRAARHRGCEPPAPSDTPVSPRVLEESAS